MKITIYIAISANGFISNERNVPDWLSPEYGQGFASICAKYQAVIMGKTTYNILAPNYLPLQKEGTTVVVTSDQQMKSDNPTVVFTKSSPADIVKMLEEKGHKEAVIIGGTLTMSAFVGAGLVDDIYFVMEPVLFNGGLPVMNKIGFDLKLQLLDVNQLNDNTVQLHYAIKK